MMALICTEMGWFGDDGEKFIITLIAETVNDIPKILMQDILDGNPMTLTARKLPRTRRNRKGAGVMLRYNFRTEAEKKAIFEMHSKGLTYTQIAERFHTTRSAISGIIRRYRAAHPTQEGAKG